MDSGDNSTLAAESGSTLAGKHDTDGNQWQGLIQYKNAPSTGTAVTSTATDPGSLTWQMAEVIYQLFAPPAPPITVVNHSDVTEELTGAATAVTAPAFASSTGNLLIGLGVMWGPGIGAVGSPPWSDGLNTWSPDSKSPNFGGSDYFNDIAYAANITGLASESATFRVGGTGGTPTAALLEVNGAGANIVAPQHAGALAVTGVNTPLITPPSGWCLIVVLGNGGNTPINQTVTNIGTASPTWTVIKNDDDSVGQDMLAAWAIVNANGTDTYGVFYAHGSASGTAVASIAAYGTVASYKNLDRRSRR